MIRGCRDCSFLFECGGPNGHPDLFGCHRVTREVCRANGWTCPDCSPGEFLRRKVAIELRSKVNSRLIGPSLLLPSYVPVLQHRYGWSGRLPFEIVAIPTSKVLGGRGGRFGPLFDSAKELRRKFRLGLDTQVLLVSVNTDPFLERYWRWAKVTRTPQRLAALDIAGITIPNFSFFSDAPRFHHLYNRGRLQACLNELADAGVPVVPHIHALTSGDLTYWLAWLRKHPEVRHVCREFQTGNDEDAVDELARLQDDVGRALHPVIVGGARFAARLRGRFAHFTIVDSRPFMAALHRRRAVDRDGLLDWKPYPTRTRREVGALLKHNIELYSESFEKPIVRQTSMFDLFDRLSVRQATSASSQPTFATVATDGRRAVRLPMLIETSALRIGNEDAGRA